MAREAHGELELGREHPEDTLDAGLAEGGEAPERGAADEDGFSAERKGFQDIAAAADAAVHEDRDFARDGFDDVGEGVESADDAVELAAAVVGYNDTGGTALDGDFSVFRGDDAFEDHREFACAADPVDVVPGKVWGVWLPHYRGGGVDGFHAFAGFGDAAGHHAVIEAVAVVAVSIGLVGVVDSEDDSFAAPVFGSFGEVDGQFFGGLADAVDPPVEGFALVEEFSGTGGGAEEGFGFESRFGNNFVGTGHNKFFTAGGGNEDGGFERDTEEIQRGIDVGDVDHDTGDEVPMAVGIAVGAEGSFVFDAASDEVVGEFVEFAAGDVFEFVDVDWTVDVVFAGAEEGGSGDVRGEKTEGGSAIHLGCDFIAFVEKKLRRNVRFRNLNAMRSFLIWFGLMCSIGFSQSQLRLLSTQFEGLVEKTDPAVVQIVVRAFSASEEDTTPLIRNSKGNGSGVIVSADGYVLTNSHVVANAGRIQVLLPQAMGAAHRHLSVLRSNGKLVNAQIVGQDRETDIAVLKLDETGPHPFLSFGDSERLREGQLVFAFGSPLGLDNSVTMGIVSAKARQVKPDDPMVYIQTDAAINPGNSGGPLVDGDGKVVGINTFIYTNSGGSEGIGFASPSNIVQTVYEQIRQHGRVRRGQIGVLAQTVSPLLGQALGLDSEASVVIEDVTPGSPAEASGLKIGDVVVSLNGKVIENARQFGVNIYQNAGKTIEVEVRRGKTPMKIPVAVLERPKDPDRLLAHLQGETSRVRRLGILAVDLDEKVIPLYSALREYTGVAVAGILADLSLEANRLQPGDVVHRLNQEPVLNLAGLRKLLDDFKHGQPVAVQIERSGQMQYVVLEID